MPKKSRSKTYRSADGQRVYIRKNPRGKINKFTIAPAKEIALAQKEANSAKFKETESAAQKAIVAFCRALEPLDERFKLFAAIPNQIKNPRFIGIYRAEGLRTGFPDMQLPWDSLYYSGIYIELKVGYNKPHDEQIDCLRTLAKFGKFACICYGSEIGLNVLRDYMQNGFKDYRERLSKGEVPVFGYKETYWI
jgi:hypothetical protein